MKIESHSAAASAAVFLALGDSTRRRLLDRLYMRNGQIAGELFAGFRVSNEAMVKHLDMLEDANLIVKLETRPSLYYLRCEPLRQIHSGWFAKFIPGCFDRSLPER